MPFGPVQHLAGTVRGPKPHNEPVRDYQPGSTEALELGKELTRVAGQTRDIPIVINGVEVQGRPTSEIRSPHNHANVLGNLAVAEQSDVRSAIDAAMVARHDWSRTPWWDRLSVFLRAAELVSGKYRDELNATTMQGQSKTFHQAEIDSACELADYLRFNCFWAAEIFSDQPASIGGEWNYADQRGLEGFVLALTPFNFTAIAGNLPATAAMMGNTVVWKPSEKSALSSDVVRRVFEEAGIPPGVINTVHGSGRMISDIAAADDRLAGLSFTGSTTVFRQLWHKVADNIDHYRSYPRLVGETGGKNAVVAHPSADPSALLTGLVRGAFEYQGQKCSAASRAYIPRSLWHAIKEPLIELVEALPVGDVTEHETFLGAVIDQEAYQRLDDAIKRANALDSHTLIAGGRTASEEGWFVHPTVFQTEDPRAFTMTEEFFGPLLTVFVYDDSDWNTVLELVDSTGFYGLSASIYATDRTAIAEALGQLRDAAGYVAVNDKPAGAVIGQQAFGGGRASGTNDKVGSPLALQRWVSGRFIKENLNPATSWRYPYMGS
ncbi:L-glutamate gamma-semialdehyde dehydrogenase [Nocardia sp. NPDC059239]|uniref:L-glutamate gamma-semialdehyde dehydrogenase n=1 Tax=Nocardia sp. NPDC059239 TaxID=3346785 RepID=UPI0036A56398